MADEVSQRLIAELEAQAKLVDRGEFTIDDAAAKTKLAQHRMAEPADWVCLVVEAANLLGATRVTVLGQVSQLSIGFDGEPLDGNAIFSSAATSEGLRKLAIAISTLFGHYAVPAVEIESPHGRVRLHAEGPNECSSGNERNNLIRVLGLHDSSRERARLVERCRYSPMVIELEYERISRGPRQWLLDRGAGGITAIVDGERAMGLVGWKPDEPLAEILIMTHGVATETVTANQWEGLAIIDVPLRKDVGERAVLRDAEFDRVMALVEAAARGVPHHDLPVVAPKIWPKPAVDKPRGLPPAPEDKTLSTYAFLLFIAALVLAPVLDCVI